ncbi:hypothetical protein [Pseudonocardia sp. ICBG601]|uniref:hypothetical protein n=1 Tax=Pseudonocardia sp. ICBG601 TaxID=2846759 RepID=UPI0035AB7756
MCRAYAAAGMVALAAPLDGVAVVWTPDGDEHRVPVATLVTGNGTTALRPGEVLRAVELPGAALRARTAFRKIALAELGRSGAVLTGRVDTARRRRRGHVRDHRRDRGTHRPALPGRCARRGPAARRRRRRRRLVHRPARFRGLAPRGQCGAAGADPGGAVVKLHINDTELEAEPAPGSAPARSCASTGTWRCARAATPGTAVPAPSCSTTGPCTPA